MVHNDAEILFCVSKGGTIIPNQGLWKLEGCWMLCVSGFKLPCYRGGWKGTRAVLMHKQLLTD